jgi:hypothetical protein
LKLEPFSHFWFKVWAAPCTPTLEFNSVCRACSHLRHFLQEIIDADDAPLPNDAVRPWPSGTVHAWDQVHDVKMAEVLNKTEFMIIYFYQKGHFTLLLG